MQTLDITVQYSTVVRIKVPEGVDPQSIEKAFNSNEGTKEELRFAELVAQYAGEQINSKSAVITEAVAVTED